MNDNLLALMEKLNKPVINGPIFQLSILFRIKVFRELIIYLYPNQLNILASCKNPNI